jgi:hypothetical protein
MRNRNPAVNIFVSLFPVSTQTLLKTKQHENPDFEIIKEVMAGSGAAVNKLLNPFGGGPGGANFNNPNLAALASLMSSGGAGGLGPAALMNPNLLLQKCESFSCC